jgi:TetR/AcrR family transcriptional repressor of nem operon
MRRSREDVRKTREALVQVASRLIRERGIAGTSVADVMGAAGMTAGGFYRHFESKEALVAEALDAAAAGARATLDRAAAAAPDPDAAFAARAEQYLSEGHRAHPERGCPLAALATEVAREPRQVRRAFGAALERAVEAIAREVPAPGGSQRAAALRAIATMVGAVALARAIPEGELCDELLAAVREDLVDTERGTH